MYCFKCPKCGLQSSAGDRDQRACGPCIVGPEGSVVILLRDYKAENAGIAVTQLKREREHSKDEYVAKFLPSNKDFSSPTDPDGTKGMRDWRDKHTPGTDNKKPYWPGEVEKRQF